MEVRRGHGKCVRGSRCQVAGGDFHAKGNNAGSGTWRTHSPGAGAIVFFSPPLALVNPFLLFSFSFDFLFYFIYIFFLIRTTSCNSISTSASTSRTLSLQPRPPHPPSSCPLGSYLLLPFSSMRGGEQLSSHRHSHRQQSGK